MKKLLTIVEQQLMSKIIAKLGYSPQAKIARKVLKKEVRKILAEYIVENIDLEQLCTNINANHPDWWLPSGRDEARIKGKTAYFDNDGNFHRNWTP